MIKKNVLCHTIYGNKKLSQVQIMTELFGKIGKTSADMLLIIFTPRMSFRTRYNASYLGYTNVRVNTTMFFVGPNDNYNDGISNIISPIPTMQVRPIMESMPMVYILPGQNYEFIFTLDKDSTIDFDDSIDVMIPYIALTKEDCEIGYRLIKEHEMDLMDYIASKMDFEANAMKLDAYFVQAHSTSFASSTDENGSSQSTGGSLE